MRTETTTPLIASAAEPHHHGRVLAAVLVGLAVLTVGVVSQWGGDAPTAPRHPVTGVDVPGGPAAAAWSVYDSQVPLGARIGNPKAPGGSVYAQQLPRGAG